ncbi:MAG: hypothetical protein WEF53_06815 [Bacteroidota bacterium]
MNDNNPLQDILGRIRTRAFQIGVAGSILLGVGAWTATNQFYESYLLAYVYWVGISLGCLGLLMLHHLVSGRWGHVIQRILEAGSRTIALMAILFLPVLAGIHHLYSWTHAAEGGHGHVAAKSAYLNVPFFMERTAVYFLFWIVMAFLLSAWSRKQDQNADSSLTRRLKITSAPGLIAFVLIGTFASVDWMMSLEPEWFSAIYGLMILAAQGLSALTFSIVVLRVAGGLKPWSDILSTTHFHHLGNLTLALTVFWAYLAFSQYLIIWSGNLPEENFWYINRLNPGWSIVGLLILIGHFFVPFLLLLSRKSKKSIRPLAIIAGGILLMRFVDYFWLVKPAFSASAFSFHWMDIVAPIAIGGLWLGFVIFQFQGASPVVLNDPRFDHGELRQH